QSENQKGPNERGMITECCFVRYKGGISTRGLALYDDRFLPGLARLASAVQAEGSLLGVQVFFDGAGRTFASDETVSIGPSDLTPWNGPYMQPLTQEEILAMADDFARSARLAQQAGADLVEIHMGHGHLLGRFLSPHFNRREDEYGGSREGRLRFPLMVVDKVRASTGGRMPVIARLSLTEQIQGGIELEEAIQIAHALKGAGVDAVHTSAGTGTTAKGLASIFPTSFVEEAPFSAMASQLREQTGMQTIFAGKVVTPGMAEQLLLDGVADLVSIGRASLADPDWALKATGHSSAPLTPCISCNQGCADQLVTRKEITCIVNPLVGFEGDARSITPLGKDARFVVVGAGPAGLSCALALAARGGSVVVYEAAAELGGQYKWAGDVPGKEQYGRYLGYLAEEVRRLGVEVRLGVTVSQDGIAAEELKQAAAIFWAGGAVQKPLQMDKLTAPIVEGWQVFEKFAASKEISTAQATQLVIVGSGQVGTDAALWLASKGYGVTLVDRLPDPLAAMGTRRYDYERSLQTLGVRTMYGYEVTGGEVSEIVAQSVENAQELRLHADIVVNATGRVPRAKPEALKNAIAIGDCVKAGSALDAVRQGTLQGAWAFQSRI
ncbi:MAG TPA: FAD-dependent oxidoreductase, partial [Chloroflexia bacterium]|nr:FAD-dependent oxidoreductase [Chloroflexia bacterium]